MTAAVLFQLKCLMFSRLDQSVPAAGLQQASGRCERQRAERSAGAEEQEQRGR